MLPEEDFKPVLNYFGVDVEKRRPPNPAYVFLLCTPGLICWILFLTDAFMRLDDAFFIIWLCAMGTALLSLPLYIRRPFSKMRWYVWINLAINIPGLLFSFLPLLALALH